MSSRPPDSVEFQTSPPDAKMAMQIVSRCMRGSALPEHKRPLEALPTYDIPDVLAGREILANQRLGEKTPFRARDC